MTENKRFTIKPQDDYFGVTDNYSTDKVNVVNGIRTEIEAEWLCELLNELSEENKQLKLQYSELEITLINNQLAYNDLNEENTRLKNEVTLLDMKLADKEKAFEKLHKMYMEQIKKNKELKAEIGKNAIFN